MKVLFATHNEAKVNRFKENLKLFNIELESLKDYKIDIEIEETGRMLLIMLY